jgi:hypothetical protein
MGSPENAYIAFAIGMSAPLAAKVQNERKQLPHH